MLHYFIIIMLSVNQEKQQTPVLIKKSSRHHFLSFCLKRSNLLKLRYCN